MQTARNLAHWREVFAQLLAGPAPRGEEFDLCRQLARQAPGSPEAATAARVLLEGAMADAVTPVATAQQVMAILKAAGQGRLDLVDLFAAP